MMSEQTNDVIRERAREAAEESSNGLLGAQLDRAIEQDDLELMRELTLAVERHLNFMENLQDETH